MPELAYDIDRSHTLVGADCSTINVSNRGVPHRMMTHAMATESNAPLLVLMPFQFDFL